MHDWNIPLAQPDTVHDNHSSPSPFYQLYPNSSSTYSRTHTISTHTPTLRIAMNTGSSVPRSGLSLVYIIMEICQFFLLLERSEKICPIKIFGGMFYSTPQLAQRRWRKSNCTFHIASIVANLCFFFIQIGPILGEVI